MLEAYLIKVPFNASSVKVLNVHTRSIRCFYCVKDVDKGYSLEMSIRARNQVSKAKSNISRALKSKMSRNELNKGNKYWDKFGYNIPNNFSGEFLLDRKQGNTLWSDAIAK